MSDSMKSLVPIGEKEKILLDGQRLFERQGSVKMLREYGSFLREIGGQEELLWFIEGTLLKTMKIECYLGKKIYNVDDIAGFYEHHKDLIDKYLKKIFLSARGEVDLKFYLVNKNKIHDMFDISLEIARINHKIKTGSIEAWLTEANDDFIGARRDYDAGAYKIALERLALAGLGISYAGFSDIIYVSGTVETAELSLTLLEYSGTWVWKEYPHDIFITDDPEFELEEEDGFLVASAFARAGGADEADVVFVFDNLFPCIDFKADFVFKYEGTIPARLWADIDYVITGDDPTTDWVAALLLVPGGITFEAWDVTDPAKKIPIDVGYQVHGGEIIEIWITIHIPQENYYQGRSATFDAWVGALQFNEDPTQHDWDN